MAALATNLTAVSNKADRLLEKHHQELFALGLDVNFNRATLATKYWLPLPEHDEPTATNEDEYPQGESDEQLFSAITECERILSRFEIAVGLKSHNILPNATSGFAQSVRKISRMIDARRQSSDSDSSSHGSAALYTQDAPKAGSQLQSYAQLSPRGFAGDDYLRPLPAPEESAQHLTSNSKTYEPTKIGIRKRLSSSAGDKDGMLSSPRGSQTQRYPPRPQNDDTNQSPYSKYPMRYKSTDICTSDKPGERPSPARMTSGESRTPEDQYRDAFSKSTTSSATRPPQLGDLSDVRDHTTRQLDARGNEYVPRVIDPSGETKVSKDGRPLEGRIFRCRTFSLPDRGTTLFMLSTDCARVLGYPLSETPFVRYESLFKIILIQSEKERLIRRGIIPASDMSQQIVVYTARSMFRQFGARLVQDGHHVRDDYWEAKAREQRFTEEDAADEERQGPAREGLSTMERAIAWASSLQNLNDRDENTP